MHTERITTAEHPLFETAISLYQESFPFHEQREEKSQRSIMAHPNYHFLALFDERNAFVGLILCWETERLIYVEHFCILPALRNRGFGSRALKLLLDNGKPVILEIDPPVDDISRRRKGFYERCDFAANHYPHIHPPYHEGHAGHALVVMSAPEPISEETYRDFFVFLRDTVMES
ncbi:MAG: GNAT family N-acetyltransferase [Clostridiales bacterium]|nr:GNAT family N-acetyltransferase [Clostridiales bacterium]